MATFTVNTASKDDIPAEVNMVYWEKLSLPLNRVMWKEWPNETAQKRRIEGAVSASFEDSDGRTYKVTDDQSGDLVGLLVLTRRRFVKSEEKSHAPSDQSARTSVPPELRADVVETIISQMDALNKDATDFDHIDVTTLVVKQALRGKTLGTQLMQKALEWAKVESLPLVVNSEPASNNFFTKLGFTYIKHCEMDLSKFAPPYSGFGPFRLTKMMWSS